MAEEQNKDTGGDGAAMNEVITLYLRGIYALKGGRLTPPQAFEHVLLMARTVETVKAVGKGVCDVFRGFWNRKG